MKKYIQEHYLIIILFGIVIGYIVYLNMMVEDLSTKVNPSTAGNSGSGKGTEGRGGTDATPPITTVTQTPISSIPTPATNTNQLPANEVTFLTQFINKVSTANQPSDYLIIATQVPRVKEILKSHNISNISDALAASNIASNPALESMINQWLNSVV